MSHVVPARFVSMVVTAFRSDRTTMQQSLISINALRITCK
jgi:hypothetical protein